MNITFEPTISLGSLITLLSIFIIGGKALIAIGSMRTKIDTMWAWWKTNVPKGAVAVVRDSNGTEE